MKGAEVYWITGLSGAGKTTIGGLLVDHLRAKNAPVVHLDGDVMRGVFGFKSKHTREERKTLAISYSKMCKMLSDQGIVVVCTTISMFDSVRQLNRDTISRYVEIYLDVPIEILIQRDQKNLYSKGIRGEVQDVLGINEVYEVPKNPDIVLENNGTVSPEEIASHLIEKIGVINK